MKYECFSICAMSMYLGNIKDNFSQKKSCKLIYFIGCKLGRSCRSNKAFTLKFICTPYKDYHQQIGSILD